MAEASFASLRFQKCCYQVIFARWALLFGIRAYPKSNFSENDREREGAGRMGIAVVVPKGKHEESAAINTAVGCRMGRELSQLWLTGTEHIGSRGDWYR